MNESPKATLSLSVNGLILAGGKSARMGHDKSLILYHDVVQREYLFSMLEKFCAVVFTSCKNAEGIPTHLNPLPDKFDFESPLNGILSAFSHDADTGWLTVPVDMPLVNENIVRYLLHKRDTQKMATCFFDSEGINPEPLLTVWEKQSHPLLLDFYRSGNKSPRDFLKRTEINIIEVPDSKALLNINNPEDLMKFKKGQQTNARKE